MSAAPRFQPGDQLVVTAEQIAAGVRFDTGRCPLAQRFKKEFPQSDVLVDGCGIHVDSVLYRMSNSLRDWMNRYDGLDLADREYEDLTLEFAEEPADRKYYWRLARE